jgi:hypothetical protein
MLRVQPVHAAIGSLAASSRPRAHAQALRGSCDSCEGFAGFLLDFFKIPQFSTNK